MKRILLLILATSSLGACVTSSKYKAQEAAAGAQKERADQAEALLAKATEELQAANRAFTETKAALEGLEKSNADLKDSLNASKTALSQKVSALIAERDELAKRLAAAEADKKALEDAKAQELERVKKSYEDMTAGLKGEIAAGQVQITQLKGRLTVNMVDQILFDSGRADVKTDGQKVLDKVGDALNRLADKDIRIEGHTDDRPLSAALREKFPSNWELSTARATAVARYLQDHAKVDPKRLVAAGFGEFRPKSSNETPEGRAQNRRIEIVLVARE